jgi:hypothetical protein
MSLKQIYNLYKTMEEENILISFKGVVTSELLSSVLQIMEAKMDSLDESPKTKKKVFNVLVECLQNLYHHIDPSLEQTEDIDMLESKSALFMIVKTENAFLIRTGNYIKTEASKELGKRLDVINSKDKDELREMYQEVLNNGRISSKGTAGLGMIDIARKSGNKLDYEFLNINDQDTFFCLNVTVN